MTETVHNTTPAEYRFLVDYDKDGKEGHGELTLNYYEIHAQMRLDGYEGNSQEMQEIDLAYVKMFVSAVRKTARPVSLVKLLSDAQLYAKGNEVFLLFSQMGNEPEPRQTSPRPMGSSLSPTA